MLEELKNECFCESCVCADELALWNEDTENKHVERTTPTPTLCVSRRIWRLQSGTTAARALKVGTAGGNGFEEELDEDVAEDEEVGDAAAGGGGGMIVGER
jgi:hypothetical protein